jgi:hypothetical protein
MVSGAAGPLSNAPRECGGVPAGLAEVHASHEGEGAVHDDELLVVGAPRDRVVVEPEAKARIGHPVEEHALHPLSLMSKDQVEVPGQDIDVESGLVVAEAIEEFEKANLASGGDVRTSQKGERRCRTASQTRV